ncbi:MAG: hypothetical protein ACR2NP_20590 [Pirellulaceae bacterium]
MTELQKWFRSVALIRRIQDDRHLWLARADVPDTPLTFITAQRLERESFRESIRREVAWELQLDSRRDFLVSNVAQLNLEFVARLPDDIVDSHIAVAFFLVDLYGKPALQAVQDDPQNIWLSSREVCDGKTDSGVTLDPRLTFLLDRAGVINPWD